LKVLLQFPEGLKKEALKHAKKLEAEGNEVIVSASPSFGACDLAIDEARSVGAEKLIHFGHAEFKRSDFNVEYVEYTIDAPLDVLESSLKELEGYKRICLVTTIQHVHQLGEISAFYGRNGKEVVLNKPVGFTKKDGQILGCDPGNVSSLNGEVDAFVYFGGGVFHPLGALVQTTKPFFAADPFSGKFQNIDAMRETIRKRSRGKVLTSLGARNFGILLSTKTGQYNIELARSLKRKIEERGLSAAILVANTFDFDSINNMMEFDVFVNTACPRLASDDDGRMRKPLLSAKELAEVLDLKEKKE
jgi:2-(3-amino-3-carboxypropyl)histidine synthase